MRRFTIAALITAATFGTLASLLLLGGCNRKDSEIVATMSPDSEGTWGNIPDNNFREALKEVYGTSLEWSADGLSVKTAKAKAINGDLDVSDKGIVSLEGIGHFTALAKLTCSGNNFSAGIDLSKNKALTRLDCSKCGLTKLDVSKNAKLTELICDKNELTKLDLTENASLKHLDCSGNQIASVDLSKNVVLEKLFIQNNALIELNASANGALQAVDCSNNPLTMIDLSALRTAAALNIGKADKITEARVNESIANHQYLKDIKKNHGSQIVISVWKTTADSPIPVESCNDYDPMNELCIWGAVPDAKFRTIIKKKYPDIAWKNESIKITDAQALANVTLDLTAEDLTSIQGIEYFTGLTNLMIGDNAALSVLDLSKNVSLTSLDCYFTGITTLDLSANVKLNKLICRDNKKLSALDIRGIRSVTGLDLGDNPYANVAVHDNLKNDDTLKTLKNNRGDDVTISTWRVAAGNIDYAKTCQDYNPMSAKCVVR